MRRSEKTAFVIRYRHWLSTLRDGPIPIARFDFAHHRSADSYPKTRKPLESCRIARVLEFFFHLDEEIPRRTIPISEFELSHGLVVFAIEHVIDAHRRG